MNYYLIVRIATYVCMVVLAFVGARWVKKAAYNLQNVEEFAIKKIDSNLSKSKKLKSSKLRLSQYGIMYRMKTYDLSPASYIMARIGFGILAGLFTNIIFGTILIAILVGFFVYFGIDMLFVKLNKADNTDMLIDLCTIYATIDIQTRSGIYIGDCLEYACEMIKNQRLKEAMEELVLNISDKTVTMTEAIDIFQSRFYSKNIRKLCTMLDNFITYGANENYAKAIKLH